MDLPVPSTDRHWHRRKGHPRHKERMHYLETPVLATATARVVHDSEMLGLPKSPAVPTNGCLDGTIDDNSNRSTSERTQVN